MSQSSVLPIACFTFQSKSFLDSLISFASSFTFAPSYGGELSGELYVGYVENPVVIRKCAFLKISKKNEGRAEGTEKYIEMLKAVSDLYHSHITADFFRVGEVGELEKVSPRFIKPAHLAAKSLSPSLDPGMLNTLFGSRKLCVEVRGDSIGESVAALVATALLSSAHRFSLALRQIAAQTLLVKALEGGLPRDDFASSLAALIADTYVWLPHAIGRVTTPLTSELLPASLSLELLHLVELLRERKASDVLDLIETACSQVLHVLKWTDPREDHVSELMESILNALEEALHGHRRASGYCGLLKREILLGRLVVLINELRRKRCEVEICGADTALVVFTEQSGPHLLNLISRELQKIRRFVVLVTPQTFFNLLLCVSLGADSFRIVKLSELLSDSYDRRGKVVAPVLVPTMEGYITRELIKALLERIDCHRVFALIQGNAMIAVPLYREAVKRGICSFVFV